jgi:hypothetical protein
MWINKVMKEYRNESHREEGSAAEYTRMNRSVNR